MSQPDAISLPPDAILTGPFGPGPVRVVRAERVGAARIQVEVEIPRGHHRHQQDLRRNHLGAIFRLTQESLTELVEYHKDSYNGESTTTGVLKDVLILVE